MIPLIESESIISVVAIGCISLWSNDQTCLSIFKRGWKLFL